MSEEKPYCIYQHVHRESGRYYIGQTKNFKQRMCNYRRGHFKKQIKLWRAVQKYGWPAFDTMVTITGLTAEEANRCETIQIHVHAAFTTGFNCTYGGDAREIQAATREKISAANTGKRRSEAVKARMRERTYSAETRQRMRAAKVGKPLPAPHKAKIAAKLVARPMSPENQRRLGDACRGKAQTPEHLAKLSKVRKGRPGNPKALEAMRKANLGRTLTPEQRAAISARQTGRTVSPEARANMSAAAKARCARKASAN